MWLDSDTLKKGYALNIYYNLRIRVWKHNVMCFGKNNTGGNRWGNKSVYKLAFECYNDENYNNVNLIHGEEHSHQGRGFTKSYQCFPQ